MSETHEAKLRHFFDAFEAAGARQDWEAYGSMFLDHFLTIDPKSTNVVGREDLVAFLPHRKMLFERAHAIGTRLASLAIDTLDGQHAIARTAWDVVFDTGTDADRDPVVLRSTFLLRKEEGWRIAVYLNHAVLTQVLGLDV